MTDPKPIPPHAGESYAFTADRSGNGRDEKRAARERMRGPSGRLGVKVSRLFLLHDAHPYGDRAAVLFCALPVRHRTRAARPGDYVRPYGRDLRWYVDNWNHDGRHRLGNSAADRECRRMRLSCWRGLDPKRLP